MNRTKSIAGLLALAVALTSRALLAADTGAAPRDVTGRVLDGAGEPLADATLLVILKTWPAGQFQQEPYTAKSDAEGKFSLPNLIPAAGQFEIQVAAFRPGYAFASKYQGQQGRGARTFKPVTLRLAKATPIALVIHDRDGQPVAQARVVPGSRQAPGGEPQLIYHMGSEPIQAVTDDAGQVNLDCFLPGDKAVVNIQLPGEEWEEHKIRIAKDPQPITISAKAVSSANPAAGSGPEAAGGPSDVTGRVLDSDGKPVVDATLLVIQKTWPAGRFQQEPFTATSDADGKFSLPNLIPAEGQFAIQVAAFRSGYAFASNYQLVQESRPRALKPITLRLAKASPIELLVKDRKGYPVAGAIVVPGSRQAGKDEPQLIYVMGSEPIQSVTDAEGHITLDCFLPGDKAVINIQLPGQDWEEHKVRIPKEGGSITVSAKAEVD